MNLQQTSDKLYGVPEGVYYGQNERVDELNNRIQSRHFADSPLEPNFNPRSVPTKYSHFPIINRRKPIQESAIQYPNYHLNANFNPGSARAPPSGFINNVDTETFLRNQFFANQHGCDQNVYVPSSNSDLYKISIVSRPSVQPHEDLFEQPQFSQTPHPNLVDTQIGNDKFFNHTRTQLRNM